MHYPFLPKKLLLALGLDDVLVALCNKRRESSQGTVGSSAFSKFFLPLLCKQPSCRRTCHDEPDVELLEQRRATFHDGLLKA